MLRMGKYVGNVSVLLLADQGYAALNSPEWISNLGPQLALLSVAADDRNGRPDRETLDALGGLFTAADRSARLDSDCHRWQTNVGGGGEIRKPVGIRRYRPGSNVHIDRSENPDQ
jgi:hypothetical protein